MSELKRELGYYSVLAIVIGNIIGSGIFLKPASMAQQFPSVIGILILWGAAGIITLMGALTNAEAANMYPETGGQYIFFKKMYGELIAFLYGWAAIIIFNTAGIASIAYVASYYLDYLFHLYRLPLEIEQSQSFHIPGIGTFYIFEYLGRKLITIFIIVFFTVFNCISTNQGSWIQRFLTGAKIGALFCIILFIFYKSGNGNILQSISHTSSFSDLHWSGFVAALAGAFWCFDGWNNVTFIGGEIKNPNQTISKSLRNGILICSLIYILFNAALFIALPFDKVQNSEFVAAAAMEFTFGSIGGALITTVVIISVLGAVNGNILSCARVSYSFAKDHKILVGIGKIHPKLNTPFYAIIANSVWSIVLVLSGTFDQLTDILIFVSWIFYGLSAFGVILLRKKYPDTLRPYKVPFYPWLPMCFVVFTFSYLITTIYTDFQNYMNGTQAILKCMIGATFIAIGLPFYYWTKRTIKE